MQEWACVGAAFLSPGVAMSEFLSHGLETYTGSDFWDGWNYVLYAQYLIDHPAETTASPLYLQFIMSGMPTSRSGAAGVVAFISIATFGEDAFAGFGLFLASCVFILTCAVGYAAMSLWSRDDWRGPLAALIGGCGLPVVELIEINNLDTLLLLALLPAALGLVMAFEGASRRMAILFGLLVGASICVQPELAPFALLAPALILAARIPHAWRKWVSWSALAALAAVSFAAPWLPGAFIFVIHLGDYLIQTRGSNVRLGSGYFQAFTDAACVVQSLWALYPPDKIRADAGRGLTTIATACLMSALLFLGVFATRNKQEARMIVLATLALLGFATISALVLNYGYIAFKFVAMAWPLMAILLAAAIYMVASSIRIRGVAIAASVVLVVPELAFSMSLSRNFYSRLVVDDIGYYRSIKEIEPLVRDKPILYLTNGDPFLWGLLFLRHSNFDPMIFQQPFFHAARTSTAHSAAKAEFILTDSWNDISCQGHQKLWRHGPYILWARDQTKFVAYVNGIENPNGMDREADGLSAWLGGEAARITMWSDATTDALLDFRVAPGPSLPQSPIRTLTASQEGRSKLFVISEPVEYRLPVALKAGISELRLAVAEAPTLTVLPNGDPRPLMVRLTTPRICPDVKSD
jgi:hypothetical protein